MRPASELVQVLGSLIEQGPSSLTFSVVLQQLTSQHGPTTETNFHVKMLPRARIPIIKLTMPPTATVPFGMACDIGFENRLALENTRLLLTYAMVDTRLRTLVLFREYTFFRPSALGKGRSSRFRVFRVVYHSSPFPIRRGITTVKVWTKRRKINNPYRGTLSSYGFVLLVIHFLAQVKQPPVLPFVFVPFTSSLARFGGKIHLDYINPHKLTLLALALQSTATSNSSLPSGPSLSKSKSFKATTSPSLTTWRHYRVSGRHPMATTSASSSSTSLGTSPRISATIRPSSPFGARRAS